MRQGVSHNEMKTLLSQIKSLVEVKVVGLEHFLSSSISIMPSVAKNGVLGCQLIWSPCQIRCQMEQYIHQGHFVNNRYQVFLVLLSLLDMGEDGGLGAFF